MSAVCKKQGLNYKQSNSVIFKLTPYCSVLMAYYMHIILLDHFTIEICSFVRWCLSFFLPLYWCLFIMCFWSYTEAWHLINVFFYLAVSESDMIKLLNQICGEICFQWSAYLQIMARCRTGDRPWSGPIMACHCLGAGAHLATMYLQLSCLLVICTNPNMDT